MVLKLQIAIGTSGLGRIGLDHCGFEASNCNWLERARADWASSTVPSKLRIAIGSSGLERIGLEHCGFEASNYNRLGRARADWPRSQWL